MLGEFTIIGDEGIPEYPEESQILIWVFFFIATVFTNVIFFNTLVSVIGEAYSAYWEKKDLY